MSEDGLHVHAAHDHELEHAAHNGDGLARQIAVFTGILAALGALVGFLGGEAQNEALFHKNQAVLMKAHASDQWSFYQSKSTKQHLMQMAAELGPAERRDAFKKEADRYEAEKKEIQDKAEEFDRKSVEADAESAHSLVPHSRLALAMSIIQVAIALASVTALTRQRWLLAPALGSAAVAIGMIIFAYVS